MSLAARCPACGTVFRVVQDQLRVSDGWVRCGRCAEVFNAIENLVDIEADPSAPASRSAVRERTIEDEAEPQAGDGAAVDDDAVDAGGPAPPLRDDSASMRQPAPAEVPEQTDATSIEAHDIRVEPGLRAEPPVAPAFVRRAERAAHWRQPRVRAALMALAIVGATLLAVQSIVEYRDLIAARWPMARPLLEQACAVAGCRVEAPRAIEALAVESSGLVRVAGTSMYRLSVVLRNRAALALAMPALDLTLTDSQGSVIARRVIGLAELGLSRTSLPAFAEMPLQATLSAAERPISGYTIEIFYP